MRIWVAIVFAGIFALSTDTSARADPVLLFEPATARVLYAEEPDQSWHPASVTKIMTAYVAFEEVKAGRIAWDSDVPLSTYARIQPATRIGLRGGIKINLEQAVRGLILRSANDFAVAIAERISITEGEFVARMNVTAKRIGMTRTYFTNPHGLPDDRQVTTARDLAILTASLLKEFPDRAEVFSTPTVRIHKGTFRSHNDLLRTLDGADGMKTGFVCASGYNIVASATREGQRLVAVVLGAVRRSERSARAKELINAGFDHLNGIQPGPDAEPWKHFKPVGMKDLPLQPAEPRPPFDMSRVTRTGKCAEYGSRIKLSRPALSPDTATRPTSRVVKTVVTKPAATATGAVSSIRDAATAGAAPTSSAK